MDKAGFEFEGVYEMGMLHDFACLWVSLQNARMFIAQIKKRDVERKHNQYLQYADNELKAIENYIEHECKKLK